MQAKRGPEAALEREALGVAVAMTLHPEAGAAVSPLWGERQQAAIAHALASIGGGRAGREGLAALRRTLADASAIPDGPGLSNVPARLLALVAPALPPDRRPRPSPTPRTGFRSRLSPRAVHTLVRRAAVLPASQDDDRALGLRVLAAGVGARDVATGRELLRRLPEEERERLGPLLSARAASSAEAAPEAARLIALAHRARGSLDAAWIGGVVRGLAGDVRWDAACLLGRDVAIFDPPLVAFARALLSPRSEAP